MYTGFWWGNLSERGHFGDPGVDGRIILMLHYINIIQCSDVKSHKFLSLYVYYLEDTLYAIYL